MVLVADSLPGTPSDIDPDIAPLRALCRCLTRRGRTALVVIYSTCGDRDVRMQVCDGGDGPVLEVLGPYAGPPADGRWHAVRITAAERVLWRGPDRDGGDDQVLGFVDDLLHRRAEELAHRYLPLG